ncbi:MAG: 2-oxoacid:acceptor oxidoreductase family protein [candidate division WOR-3 bacterium]
MGNLLEIRWHGRGGQGAKTAALLFGEAALETGKYIQAFPEYGPERMGAPVTAYNRLSDEPIQIHSAIKNPNIVVVLDPTLISNEVLEGLPQDGILLVNTKEEPKVLKQRLKLENTKLKVFTVDATQIAIDTIGRPIPNTPMLGALVKVTGVLNFDSMLGSIRKKLLVKFRGNEKLVEGNVASVKRAYEEVKSE